VYLPGARAVAISPTTTGILSPSTLVRSRSIIRPDSSMPVTGTARSAKGTGHATGSDCELERSAVACKFGEAVNRRPQHLGGGHASSRGVVALGSIEIPNLVLAHGDDPVNELLPTSNGFWERPDLPPMAKARLGRMQDVLQCASGVRVTGTFEPHMMR
jgi:hypothetical protein